MLGTPQIEFVDFGIAGDEVVVVHLRTLSLSGYLMLECKVVETLSDESDSISPAIRESGQIVGPTLALWSSRRHPFQKLYYCGLSDLMKSDICDVKVCTFLRIDFVLLRSKLADGQQQRCFNVFQFSAPFATALAAPALLAPNDSRRSPDTRARFNKHVQRIRTILISRLSQIYLICSRRAHSS